MFSISRPGPKAASLGLADHVVFTGRIPEAEKVAHYNLADVYVMPSYGEGFGIVLIEAAACGVPVVGSKADGSCEALLEGELGQLVDPKDPVEIAAAVTKALERETSRQRNEAIKIFDTANFRIRVADWLNRQV